MIDLFNNAPDSLIIIDRKTTILMMNDKAKQSFPALKTGDTLSNRIFFNKSKDNLFRSPLIESLFSSDFENIEISYKGDENDGLTAFYLMNGKNIIDDNGPNLYLSLKNVTEILFFENIFEDQYDELIKATTKQDALIEEIRKAYSLLKEKDEEMAKELNIAKDVQKNIFSVKTGRLRNYQFFSKILPAKTVSGDFFTVIDSDDRFVDLVIADVTGHGVPSALVTMMIKMSLETRVREFHTPQEIMEHVNHDLFKLLSTAYIFLTMLYIRLETETGVMKVYDFGHFPPIIVGKNRNVNIPKINGLMLGIKDELDYGYTEITIEPGEALYLITDGLTEARNANGEFYESRFFDKISRLSLNEPEAIVRDIISSVKEFADKEYLDDDLTLVCMKRIS